MYKSSLIFLMLFVSAFCFTQDIADSAITQSIKISNPTYQKHDTIAVYSVSDSSIKFMPTDSLPPPAYCKTIYDPSGYIPTVHNDSLKFRQSDRYVKHAGSQEWLYKGVKYIKVNDSIQIPAVNGNHYVYYDDNMALQVTQSVPPMYLPTVAMVYWGASQGLGFCGDERHGAVMNWKSHEWKHKHVGTQFNSGLALTAGNTSFSLGAGSIDDEDITHVHDAVTKCNIAYYNGSSSYVFDTSNTTLYKGTAGALYYNNGTALTAVSSNSYVASFVFATNDINGKPFVVLGQRQDTNISDALVNNKLENLLLSTLPMDEYKLIWVVIYRNDATPYEQSVDYRTTSITGTSSGGSGGVTDHTLLSNISSVKTAGHIDALNVLDSVGFATDHDLTLKSDTGHIHAGIVIAGKGITVNESTGKYTVSLYEPTNIVTITNNKLTNYVGQTVTSAIVSWTLSGASPTLQTLTDCTLNPSDRSFSFYGLSLVSDKTYTLIATDGTESDTGTTIVRFYVSKFYGTTALSIPDEAALESGTNTWATVANSSRAQSSVPITGGGNYIFYAYPLSWGNVQIYVNGFASTWIKSNVSVTNAYGDARAYTVYTSPTVITGAITLLATGI